MKFKLPPHYITLLKWLFSLVLVYLLYRQVVGNQEFENVKTRFLAQWQHKESHVWLVFMLLLLPINWLLEIEKWRTLLRINPVPSRWILMKAVFTGITFSLFTPNRIGEYGGRVWWLEKQNRWQGVIATMLGSFAQQIILLSAGMIGLVYFLVQFHLIGYWAIISIVFLCIAFSSVLLFLYFNIDLSVLIFKRVKWMRRWIRYVASLRHYSNKILIQALFLGFLRYTIYTIQYYLMMKFYQIDIAFLDGILCTMAIFLLQTSIPLPPITGLLVRGEIAIYVWSFFKANTISVIASTFSVWFINLILPAIIGVVFLSRLKLGKE